MAVIGSWTTRIPVVPGTARSPSTTAITVARAGWVAKIDFIFVRENRLAGSYPGDWLSISTACDGYCSDHRIVIGAATVDVNL